MSLSLASFSLAFSSPASITGSAQTSNSAWSSSAASSSASSVASSTSSCSSCDVCLSYNYSPTANPNVLDDDVNLKKRQGVGRFEKRARVSRNGIRDTKAAKKQCTVSTFTRKPDYPGPGYVGNNKINPANNMVAFFATATCWAVPTTPAAGLGEQDWKSLRICPQTRHTL